MKKIVTKTIGKEKHVFQVEGENLHACLMEANKMSFPDIHKCDLCGSDDLKLDAYTTEADNFNYVVVRCNKCKGTLNMGQQKKQSDVYYYQLKYVGNGKDKKPMKDEKGNVVYNWRPYGSQQESDN